MHRLQVQRLELALELVHCNCRPQDLVLFQAISVLARALQLLSPGLGRRLLSERVLDSPIRSFWQCGYRAEPTVGRTVNNADASLRPCKWRKKQVLRQCNDLARRVQAGVDQSTPRSWDASACAAIEHLIAIGKLMAAAHLFRTSSPGWCWPAWCSATSRCPPCCCSPGAARIQISRCSISYL